MKHFIPQLNIDNARAEYYKSHDGTTMHDFNLGFSYYSPAYVITNEDIRWVSGLTANDSKRVLTTTGSGDQAMFYAMRGAEKIDTFDISFCAKAIMDIKSSAIKKLSRAEYVQLLENLHNAKRISDVPGISNILNDIPSNSAYFIRQMDEYDIFGNGLSPKSYAENLPSDTEYDAMREQINHPFKFIWTDIKSLHMHLVGEYDVINLSNIFEYLNESQIHQILASLRTHIRPGGTIIAQTGSWGIARKNNAYYNASQKFKRWAKIGYIRKDKTNSEKVSVLQRIR